MKFAAINNDLQQILKKHDRELNIKVNTGVAGIAVRTRHAPPVLLPYQCQWLADDSTIKVWEKSRRIGASWAEACDSVLNAAEINGKNTIYISYNYDMTEDFICNCAFWVKSFNIAASDVEEVLADEGSILTYQIRFTSGKTIKALSGKPNNIRGKQARVVIDEAAFCDDLDELMKASIALLIWGGQIRLLSTHNGVDNPFNQVIQRIKKGELDYSLHTTTLDDALADGLYKRICLVQTKEWTVEGEAAWYSRLRQDYGIGAEEELDCEPFSAKSGKLFKPEWVEIVDEVPSGGITVRFYDLAATAADVREDAFYTAGVKMKKVSGIYYIFEPVAEQVSPGDADELIVDTAKEDTPNVRVRWELEGGSAGKRDEYHLRSLLKGFDASGVKPLGDKVMRFKPFASEAKRGNVKLLRGDWNDRYLNALYKFDGTKKPYVNDLADASSGAYNELAKPPQRVDSVSRSYATW